MSKKKPMDPTFDLLETRCSVCDGEGRVQDESWIEFWHKHKHDWKEMIDKGKSPGCDEWVACSVCEGVGYFKTEFGVKVLDFIKRHV